jgi:uroporphyrinogen-III synthase
MAARVAEHPLEGCGVAVTRPAHQAEPLCRALEAAGAIPLRFPTLAIEALPPPAVAAAAFDWIVYTSANAVVQAGALQRVAGRIAAIGPGTAAALAAAGLDVAVVARGDGSESLLAALAPQLAAGQRALLITGRDGRDLLPASLRARGLAVELAEVYARRRPDSDPAGLLEARRRGALHAVTTTSNETLANLHAMLGPAARALLDEVQLVVASERAVRLARELGIARAPVVAKHAGADALVAALAAWWPSAAHRPDRTRTDHGR